MNDFESSCSDWNRSYGSWKHWKRTFWKNLSEANVCTSTISLPFYENLRVKIAGKIKNFNEADYLSDKNGLIFKDLDMTDKYALKTIDMAIKDSKINLEK